MAKHYRKEFDCRKCSNNQYVSDPEKHREGLYCIPIIQAVDRGEDWKGLHADDDRCIRCDFYSEIK